MAHKYVYLFSEGSKDMRNLLGGKGANLAEMTNLGMPVPQGFTITTEACIKYYDDGETVSQEIIDQLAANGQIATQYVDLSGEPTYDVRCNPNDSACAIEGITSPDGRVFGKMGHSERIGSGLYRNVPGIYENRMFEAAVKYFKG